MNEGKDCLTHESRWATQLRGWAAGFPHQGGALLTHFNNTHPQTPQDWTEMARKGWECSSGRVVEWEKGACV